MCSDVQVHLEQRAVVQPFGKPVLLLGKYSFLHTNLRHMYNVRYFLRTQEWSLRDFFLEEVYLLSCSASEDEAFVDPMTNQINFSVNLSVCVHREIEIQFPTIQRNIKYKYIQICIKTCIYIYTHNQQKQSMSGCYISFTL